jgi:hypothetical protein
VVILLLPYTELDLQQPYTPSQQNHIKNSVGVSKGQKYFKDLPGSHTHMGI